MFNFNKIDPVTYALLAAVLGLLLVNAMDVDEQNSFGNFLVTIGQSLLTSAAQSVNLKGKAGKSDLLEQLDRMSVELSEFKKLINRR